MYHILLNVPKAFKTPDLRNFFFSAIEDEFFDCFHYRHRPLTYLPASLLNDFKVSEKPDISQDEYKYLNTESCCCIIKINPQYTQKFITLYDNKFWINSLGNVMPWKCFVRRLNTIMEDSPSDVMFYKSRKELIVDKKKLSMSNIDKNIEFKPPPEMPFGNVGTPYRHFEVLIKSCKMPSSYISKLGLDLKRKRRKRRYSKVPMNYGTTIESGSDIDETIAFTATGELIPFSFDFQSYKPKKILFPLKLPVLEASKEDNEDGNDVEEWERYESFHEDVTKQGRIEERLYEEEIELLWEKGGPGLVFYTDAQYWKEKEGDFDEQTADEWDVDMSGYFEAGAANNDGAASLSMLHMNKLRVGKLSLSAFGKKGNGKSYKKEKVSKPVPIGAFEEHTRGFGRRLLESQGWTDGQGLGRSNEGMPYALDNDGQHPSDKKGFGYHGEKVIFPSSNTQKSVTNLTKPKKKFLISTIYDKKEDTDEEPNVLRSSESTRLKHRLNPYPLLFKRSSDTERSYL